MTDLTLYGHPDSGHACKVALALSLAGLPHRTVHVDIWAKPHTRPKDFLAASPFAEVPLLMMDGVAYTQSGAILLALATQYNCLGAETLEGLQRARAVLMWEANRIGMCVPQLKEAKRVNGEGFAPEVIEWLEKRFEVDAANFDKLLGGGAFFHGDAPGVGDCAVWGYTQWLAEAGLTPTPTMRRWLDRMRGLPGMQTPMAFFPA